MDRDYDYRHCSSLFGYSASVHRRSGAICQLCGAGSERLDFDLWRQLTVEHLIGQSQGGYLSQILSALVHQFPHFTTEDLAMLARRIDEAAVVLETKRRTVRWKLSSVRQAYEQWVVPGALQTRHRP